MYLTQNCKSKQQRTKPKVAIIGASYAGLTLANYLKKESISFVVFESSPSYNVKDANNQGTFILKPNLFVIGPFLVPSFRRIAHALGIEAESIKSSGNGLKETNHNCCHVDHSNSTQSDQNNCFERSDIIRALLRNVIQNVQFDTCISSITTIKNNEHKELSCYCMRENLKDSSNTGPFEFIIAADGVHSIVGSNYKVNHDRILLIGDARWVNDSWYDFGFHRVKEGADVALNDGYELGRILKKVLSLNGSFGEDKARSLEDTCLKRFSAYEKYKLRKKRGFFRRCIFIMVLAYVLGKFLKGTHSQL